MIRSPSCPPATWNRFWLKVDRGGPGGCWLWTGARNSTGYAVFNVAKKRLLAHRFAYELLVGPIPDGMLIDHVWDRGCRHRHCVNPAHLEPVTSAQNRGRGIAAEVARRKEIPTLPASRPAWCSEAEWAEVNAFNAARRAAS